MRQRLSEFEKKWTGNPWVDTRVESPLDFSYEDDLIRIVTADDNWRNIFRACFGSKVMIEAKVKEIRWLRDHVAHFRALDLEQLAKLRGLCKDVMLSIARAAKVQADSNAPEGLLSPSDLLAGDKEPAKLVASAQRRAASDGHGEMRAVTEQLAVVEERLLDMIFEEGASPDESDVEATAIHWLFDEWQRAPENEVLAWQVYVPSEPVARGSTAYLAIRYSPAALRARPSVKRRANPPFTCRQIDVSIDVFEPSTARYFGASHATWRVVGPEGWAYWAYTPARVGRYVVEWSGELPHGTNPDGINSWARAEFIVRPRRRTTGRK